MAIEWCVDCQSRWLAAARSEEAVVPAVIGARGFIVSIHGERERGGERRSLKNALTGEDEWTAGRGEVRTAARSLT